MLVCVEVELTVCVKIFQHEACREFLYHHNDFSNAFRLLMIFIIDFSDEEKNEMISGCF